MRLSIGDTFQSAVLSLWKGGRSLAICLVLWAGAESAYTFAQQTFDPVGRLLFANQLSSVLDVRSLESGMYFPLKRLIDDGLQDLVRCVFIAAMLRIILTGKVGILGAGPRGLARAAVGVLLVSLAATTAINAPSWLLNELEKAVSQTDRFGIIDIGLPLLIAVVLAYLAARLCLVYSSVAVGQGLAILRNWRCTQGNGIRLVVVFAMVVFGIGIADRLLNIVIFDELYPSVPILKFAGANSRIKGTLSC